MSAPPRRLQAVDMLSDPGATKPADAIAKRAASVIATRPTLILDETVPRVNGIRAGATLLGNCATQRGPARARPHPAFHWFRVSTRKAQVRAVLAEAVSQGRPPRVAQ